jgi:hypothetical protein
VKNAARMSAAYALASIAAAWAGLVAKASSSSTPASSRRSSAAAQASGQVQGAVDDGVPAAGGKGEVDGDLAQADPAQGAGVLGCGTGRVGGGLRIAGLIGDQHCVAVVELRHRPGRRRVQYGPLVPGGAREQVLQPVRSGVADRFGQRPAVRVLQFHQQAPAISRKVVHVSRRGKPQANRLNRPSNSSRCRACATVGAAVAAF